jgi:argininosuccinate synthase
MSTKQKKNCILAYSGGLDTSAIVPWLIEQGYTVHAVLVDVGQDEDLPALKDKALRCGAQTAIIRDMRPAMFANVIPYAIGLCATYEGTYRLGTALARPFIALAQVERARELGGATLVHGATGKGNDQIRFEFAYKSLLPGAEVLAPWKVWSFSGRKDLIAYLAKKGLDADFAVSKDYSMDENLWHLSVEGGALEDPTANVAIEEILGDVQHRFAGGGENNGHAKSVTITLKNGVPVAVNGESADLPDIIADLNRAHRHAPWAWDLVIENRFTGIKSRGLYINPAAKLLHTAVDALARTVLNKPLFDEYTRLGQQYANMLYRGEYFSAQRITLQAAADTLLRQLNGTVTVQLAPALYAAKIDAPAAIFRHSLSTFEKSDYQHKDAEGFINLTWLSLIGQPFNGQEIHGAAHAGTLETDAGTPSDLQPAQPVPGGGLVSSAA